MELLFLEKKLVAFWENGPTEVKNQEKDIFKLRESKSYIQRLMEFLIGNKMKYSPFE